MALVFALLFAACYLASFFFAGLPGLPGLRALGAGPAFGLLALCFALAHAGKKARRC